MKTEQNKDSKTDLTNVAKKVTQNPVFKFAVVTGGVILICYGSIFAMNLVAKMITAYKGVKRAQGSQIAKSGQSSNIATDK